MSDTKDIDDPESLYGGDLGLGRGLRPGGIPNSVDISEDDSQVVDPADGTHPAYDRGLQTGINDNKATDDNASQVCNSCQNTFFYIIKCDKCRATSTNGKAPLGVIQQLTKNKPGRSSTRLKLLRRTKSDLQLKNREMRSEEFPVFDDVPLGTSIRQQRKLYEKNRREIFDQENQNERGAQTERKEERAREPKKDSESYMMLAKKLRSAEREIEVLRCELENCEKISESRYKAMRLFKGHSYAVQSQQLDNAKKANILNKALQVEVNQLQFELQYQQASMMTSQEMWTERFNRVSRENQSLTVDLGQCSEQNKKLQAEKSALVRERDELLALLDVQERQRYESSRSQTVEDSNYSNFTTTELAVLGACRCRIQSPQPCGCAHAAAYMKREITRLKGQVVSIQKREDEALILADAYRIAFEEQLNRNSGLMRRLVDISSSPCNSHPQVSKPRAALRWLIKQLNDEDPLPPLSSHEASTDTGTIDSRSSDGRLSDFGDIDRNFSESTDSEYRPQDSIDTDSMVTAESRELTCDSQDNLWKDDPERKVDEDLRETPPHNGVADVTQNGGTDITVTASALGPAEQQREAVTQEGAPTRVEVAMPPASSAPVPKVYAYNELMEALQNKKDEELLSMLLEMINDRTEALTHQRLAARMLAKRLTDLEAKLAQLTGNQQQ